MDHRFTDRIIYTCKTCGWQTSIYVGWSDMKPRKCFANKCKTSFIRNPELLDIKMPEVPAALDEAAEAQFDQPKKKKNRKE